MGEPQQRATKQQMTSTLLLQSLRLVEQGRHADALQGLNAVIGLADAENSQGLIEIELPTVEEIRDRCLEKIGI